MRFSEMTKTETPRKRIARGVFFHGPRATAGIAGHGRYEVIYAYWAAKQPQAKRTG